MQSLYCDFLTPGKRFESGMRNLRRSLLAWFSRANETVIIFAALLIIGLGIFSLMLKIGAPTRLASDTNAVAPDTPIGTTLWKDFLLVQRTSPMAALFNSIGFALITVSIFELARLLTQRLLDRAKIRRQFEDFFGDGAAGLEHAGVIVLQSDTIGYVLKDIVTATNTTPDALLNDRPLARFYKARHWVNRWDADGARVIREAFQKRGFVPPKIEVFDHSQTFSNGDAPCEISMGLGYTDETTTNIRQICDKWMCISKDTFWGDTVSLHHKLLPTQSSRFFRVTDGGRSYVAARQTAASQTFAVDDDGFLIDRNNSAFRLLLPRKSDKVNEPFDLDTWLDRPADVRDYAIVLRHTRDQANGRRQVFFALCGYTERGTAAAGNYLATNWRRLYREHVAGRSRGSTRGDFLIAIEGPSDSEKISDWSTDPEFAPITPQLLATAPTRINCLWTDRMAAHDQESDVQ